LSRIGLLIAMSFGTQRDQMRPDAVLRELAGNPIILAFLLGIAWNLLEWPHQGPVLTILFGALDFAGNSLTFLTAALVGLTLKPITRADLGWPLAICAALLLVVEPVVAYQSHFAIGESRELSYLLLLLASMPSASISIAFSLRYGCNAVLASKLVAGTTLCSIVTLPLFAWLAG
jgi:predicted permease